MLATCLHQGGPLERGTLYELILPSDDVGCYVADTTREILKCPWHGYEYNIRTGGCVFDETRRLAKFQVHEKDGEVVVELVQPPASVQ
jgi:nitrite reductase/ring-hydroxylating ferredoxin subunit